MALKYTESLPVALLFLQALWNSA